MGLDHSNKPTLDHEESLLLQGVNSAGAVLIRNALSESLSLDLPVTILFDHTTLTSLSSHLVQKIQNPNNKVDQIQQIKDDVDQINKGVVLKGCEKITATNDPKSVLITGTTGFFGCHFLAEILNTTQAIVHCLVRARNDEDAYVRVKGKMEDQMCWKEQHKRRIVAHAGDLAEPELGLGQASFFSELDR